MGERWRCRQKGLEETRDEEEKGCFNEDVLLTTVLDAMITHESVPSVQSAGCATLLSLCYYAKYFDPIEEITSSGIISQIIISLKRFPPDESLQLEGCKLILHLLKKGGDSAAVAIIQEKPKKIVKKTLENHVQKCGTVAEELYNTLIQTKRRLKQQRQLWNDEESTISSRMGHFVKKGFSVSKLVVSPHKSKRSVGSQKKNVGKVPQTLNNVVVIN